MINVEQWESWIQRVTQQSIGSQSFDELTIFLESPNAIDQIVNHLNTGTLSQYSRNISLSMIPKVKNITKSQNESLKSWFLEYCSTEVKYSQDKTLLQLASQVFNFIYQSSHDDAIEFIKYFAQGNNVSKNFIMKLSIEIIEEHRSTEDFLFLLPIYVIPFQQDDSNMELFYTCGQILLLFLSEKYSTIRFIKNTLIALINIHAPQSFFYIMEKFGSPITNCYLEVIFAVTELPGSVYPSAEYRDIFLQNVISGITTFAEKNLLDTSEIPLFLQISSNLKNLLPMIAEHEKLTPIIAGWIKQIYNISSQVLSPENMIENHVNAELILEFWSCKTNIGFLSGKVESDYFEAVKGLIFELFFSEQSSQNAEFIFNVLIDESSLIISKIISFAKFQLQDITKAIIDMMNIFINSESLINVAFCLDYLSHAIKLEELAPFTQNIIEDSVQLLEQFPLIQDSNEIQDHAEIFEKQLIKFFKSICNVVFLKKGHDLEQILEKHQIIISQFLVRFLREIQKGLTSSVFIDEIMTVLDFEDIPSEYIHIFALNEQIYDLIFSSHFLEQSSSMSKKNTIMLFKSLFLLGFSLPDSQPVDNLLSDIISKYNSDKEDLVVYSMISGAALAKNCNFGYLINNIQSTFLQPCIDSMSTLKIDQLNTIMRMIRDLTNPIHKLDQMSPEAINFFRQSIHACLTCILRYEQFDACTENYKLLSNILIVAKNLVEWDCINIGILKYYGDNLFEELLAKLSNILILIPLNQLFENLKLLQQFILFMSSWFVYYHNSIFNNGYELINHIIHSLLLILDQNNKEIAKEAAKALTNFVQYLDEKRTNKLKDIEHEIGPVLDEVFFKVMRSALYEDAVSDEFLNLLKNYGQTQVDARNKIIAGIIDQCPLSAQSSIHIELKKLERYILDRDKKETNIYLRNSIRQLAELISKNQISIII